jgi:ligand-binding sensor domain-containing protein
MLGLIALLALPEVQRGAGLRAPRVQGLQVIRPPGETSALALQGDVLWAGGDDGVVGLALRDGRITARVGCQPALADVRALLAEADGTLWIGHERGLTRFANSRCTTFGTADGLPDRQVRSLLRDREGRLWVGTWHGAARGDGERWRRLDTPGGPADDRVAAMLEDGEGGMWFGLQASRAGGLARCDAGGCRRFAIADGLPHEHATALLLARDGSVWAGFGEFDRGGAARLAPRGQAWAVHDTLSTRDGLAGNSVRSIHQDRDGALWFGSEYNGLARLEGGSRHVIGEDAGLSHREVKAIVQHGDRTLWLATGNGVTRVAATTLDALRGEGSRSDPVRKETRE